MTENVLQDVRGELAAFYNLDMKAFALDHGDWFTEPPYRAGGFRWRENGNTDGPDFRELNLEVELALTSALASIWKQDERRGFLELIPALAAFEVALQAAKPYGDVAGAIPDYNYVLY